LVPPLPVKVMLDPAQNMLSASELVSVVFGKALTVTVADPDMLREHEGADW